MILPRNVFTLKHALSARIMACLWHGSFDSGYKFFVLVLESSFISIFRQLIQALSSIIELSLQSFPLISNFVSMKVHAWTSNQDNWFKSSPLLNVVYAPPHKKKKKKTHQSQISALSSTTATQSCFLWLAEEDLSFSIFSRLKCIFHILMLLIKWMTHGRELRKFNLRAGVHRAK